MLLCLIIADNSSLGVQIRFEQAMYIIPENVGTQTVCATLDGVADRDIVVTFEVLSIARDSAQGMLIRNDCEWV